MRLTRFGVLVADEPVESTVIAPVIASTKQGIVASGTIFATQGLCESGHHFVITASIGSIYLAEGAKTGGDASLL